MPDVDRLLALANAAALHRALLTRVPGAKYRTVARWTGVNRVQPPAEMVQPILDAFGLADIEKPPPWWAGVESRLLAEIRANRDEIVKLTGGELAALKETMNEFLTEPSQPALPPVEAPAANGRRRRAARGDQPPTG